MLEHYGTEEEQKKQKQAPSQFKKPVKKVIAFGKISIKKEKWGIATNDGKFVNLIDIPIKDSQFQILNVVF